MAALRVCLFIQVTLVPLLCPGAFGVCTEKSFLAVTTPGSLEALSGSCVQIPCTFEPVSTKNVAFDASKSVTGIWMKTNHDFRQNPLNVVYNGSLAKYPMNITGDLRKKNCTTLFYNLTTEYSDRYYFRIENRPYQATAVCDPLRITVTDSPRSPSLDVSGNQTESEVVTITCSAVTPCPHAHPQLIMDLHQGITKSNITETNPDRTLTTKTKLSITLTDSHDGLMINCSAVYPVSGGAKTANSSITLSVTYGPKDTSVEVSPPGSLSVGQSVTLSCSSRANPPVQTFTWFRHSSQGPVSVFEGETYNLNFTDDEDFYCVASNGLRNDSSPVVKLITEETITPSVLLWAILGTVIGLLIVLFLAVFVWYFRSNYQKSGETEGETFEMSNEAAEQEESIHYGEIHFSNLRPKSAVDTEREETVYAQVRVSKPQTTQPTENVEELYANVHKK